MNLLPKGRSMRNLRLSYRPHCEILESRLALGDTLLGFLGT